MDEKIKIIKNYIDNNKEIKVNITSNKMSQETAQKFVSEVNNWYNNYIIEDKKVG